MTPTRLIAVETTVWVVLVTAAALVLVALATAVDGGGRTLVDAMAVGVLRSPTIVLTILPVLVGLAGGLGAARMGARGERLALDLGGHRPDRLALGGASVALLTGVAGLWIHGGVVPHLEATADLRVTRAAIPWVFLDDRAIRVQDGRAITLGRDGGIEELSRLRMDASAAQALLTSVQRQQPVRASAGALREAVRGPLYGERHGRYARVIACALLGFIAWLPLARRPGTQVVLVTGAGLGWATLDLGCRMLAAQGHLSVVSGAWGALLWLLLVSVLGLWRSTGPRSS